MSADSSDLLSGIHCPHAIWKRPVVSCAQICCTLQQSSRVVLCRVAVAQYLDVYLTVLLHVYRFVPCNPAKFKSAVTLFRPWVHVKNCFVSCRANVLAISSCRQVGGCVKPRSAGIDV